MATTKRTPVCENGDDFQLTRDSERDYSPTNDNKRKFNDYNDYKNNCTNCGKKIKGEMCSCDNDESCCVINIYCEKCKSQTFQWKDIFTSEEPYKRSRYYYCEGCWQETGNCICQEVSSTYDWDLPQEYKFCTICRRSTFYCDCYDIGNLFDLKDTHAHAIESCVSKQKQNYSLSNMHDHIMAMHSTESDGSMIEPQSFFMKEQDRNMLQEALAFTKANFPLKEERKDWRHTIEDTNMLFAKFTKDFSQFDRTINKTNNNLSANITSLHMLFERYLPDSTERSGFINEISKFNFNCEKFLTDFNPENVSHHASKFAEKQHESFSQILKRFGLVSLIASSLIALHYTRDKTMLTIAILSMCAYIYCFGKSDIYDLFEKIMMSIIKYLEPDYVEAQDGNSLMMLASTLISGLGMAYTKKSYATEIYDKLSNFGRISSSLETLYNGVVSVVEWIVNIIRDKVLDLPMIRFLDAEDNTIREYLARVDTIFELNRTGKLARTEDHYLSLVSLAKEGRDIYTKFPNNVETRSMLRMFDKDLAKLNNLVKEFEDCNMSMRGSRVETVIVYLYGGSGCGKSITTEHLAFAMCAKNLSDVDLPQFESSPYTYMYNFVPENGYHDGYDHKKFVTISDDAFQNKITETQVDNDYMAVVRIGNGYEYHMHMSKTEDKSNTFFRSAIAVFNTNRSLEQPINCLEDKEAFTRRLTVKLLVTVKLEYCTDETKGGVLNKRKLDPSKLPKVAVTGVCDISNFTYEAQEFYKMNDLGKPIGEALTFDDVVNLVQKEHETRKIWHDLHKDNFKSTINKYRRKPTKDEIKPQTGSETPSVYMTPMGDESEIDIGEVESKSVSMNKRFSEWADSIKAKFTIDYAKSVWTRMLDYWKENKVYILAILAIVLASKIYWGSWFGVLPSLWKIFFPNTPVPQSFSFGSKMASKKVDNKSTKNFMQHLKSVSPQAYDTSGLQVIEKILKNSSWYITYKLPDGTTHSLGCAIGLKDHYIWMPFHYNKALLSYITEDEKVLDCVMTFVLAGKQDNHITIREFLTNQSYDLISKFDQTIFKSPLDFPASPNIMDKIATEKEHDLLDGNLPFVLPAGHSKKQFAGIAKKYTTELVVNSDRMESYTVNKTFVYTAMTTNGDCGSPVFILNTRIQNKKLFAMHIAGNSNTNEGYGSAAYREALEVEMDKFDKTTDIEQPIIKVDSVTNDVQPQNGMIYVGNIKQCPTPSENITLIPSKLEGKFRKTIHAIAQLRPIKVDGELKDPMHNALMKYCLPRVYIPRSCMYNIADETFDFMYTNTRDRLTPRLFTYKEAIHGLEIDAQFRPMKISSGPGYPMNVRSLNCDMKTKYFANPDKVFPEISEHLDDCIRSMKEGKRLLWIYTDKLKIDKRPIEKVKQVSSRMYSSVPFYLFILFRIYFGSFTLWLTKNADVFGMSNGVNPYSLDWHKIYLDLAVFDDGSDINSVKVGAGDYEKFDGSEQSLMLMCVYHIISRYYLNASEIDNKIRLILWQEIVNSIHINQGRIFIWNGSLSSGNPLTFFINCIVNILGMRYAKSRVITDMVPFHKVIVLKVGGDDNIFSTKQEYRDIFNELTLPPLLAEVGLRYTTEIKSTAVQKFRCIKDTEFLKRTFRVCKLDNKVVGPMRYSCILDYPLWTRKDKPEATVTENVINCMREMSLWAYNTDVDYDVEGDLNYLKKTFEQEYPFVELPIGYTMSLIARKREVKTLDYVIPDS